MLCLIHHLAASRRSILDFRLPQNFRKGLSLKTITDHTTRLRKVSTMTEQKPLIAFPTHFDLKIMGAAHPDFASEILKTIQQHAPNTTEQHVKIRPSSKGNYLGATVTVYAENQEHLDNIYRAVTSHPMVKVVY